ncbi:MAG TPA: nucleotidyl transferase AbiEii/AbiGii toxin family protein [Planctomycetaceae bacterium]|jgi:predicted nucleotidyltransferase
MTDIVQVLKRLSALFEEHGLEFAVMGGFAVRTYAIPRPTYDVDFTLAVDRPGLVKIFAAVKQLGLTVPEEYERGWTDKVGGMPVVKFRHYLQDRGIDIDVFLAENEFQRGLLARRRKEAVNGFSTWVVSAEDLILLKLLANRPRDLLDVQDVLFTQGQLDEQYLRKWADELNVSDRLERALAEQQGI